MRSKVTGYWLLSDVGGTVRSQLDADPEGQVVSSRTVRSQKIYRNLHVSVSADVLLVKTGTSDAIYNKTPETATE